MTCKHATTNANEQSPAVHRHEVVIGGEYYFTATQGVWAAGVFEKAALQNFVIPESLSRLTFCVLVTANGHAVAGIGAVSSAEADPEAGRDLARQDALRKLAAMMLLAKPGESA